MIRKAALLISAFLQYWRIRNRKKEQLHENDLAQICQRPPLMMAEDVVDLFFILETLRPLARRLSPQNLCLDMSLVLISMSNIPAKIHFSVHQKANSYTGHAWVEAAGSLLSTDYSYDKESIWSWEKA